MVTCPEGHTNPPHWEFRGQCGGPDRHGGGGTRGR